ncbi:hypothetical protein FXO37_10621 [Capsicum annuum]|nr:hypothetical protein FXO37_10621 [Capsicum annuum]
METQMCIQCLQRRIESDFSDQFIFCYGLSDSPLPLGSTIVVQNEDRQFTLKFSAMEIYNEVVRDLLTPDNTPLRLLNDPEVNICFKHDQVLFDSETILCRQLHSFICREEL